MSWNYGISCLKSICAKITKEEGITLEIYESLKAIYGEKITTMTLNLLKSNIQFLYIKSKEYPNISVYAVVDPYELEKDYIFLDTSEMCTCKSSDESFLNKGYLICHHLIALEIAKRLGLVSESQMSVGKMKKFLHKRSISCVTMK